MLVPGYNFSVTSFEDLMSSIVIVVNNTVPYTGILLRKWISDALNTHRNGKGTVMLISLDVVIISHYTTYTVLCRV